MINAVPANPDIPVRSPSELDTWRLVILIIASIPVFHALATWDADGNLGQFNHILRVYSLPVIFLEIAIIIFAFWTGWRPLRQIIKLSRSVRFALVAFVACGTLSSIAAGELAIISLLNFSRYLVQALLFAALVHILKNAKEFSFLSWLAYIAAGSVAYVLLLALFCLQISSPESFRWTERLPSATNVRQIGNVVALIAIVPVGILLMARDAKTRIAASLIQICLLAFVMWSGSRGGLLGYGVALVSMALFCRALFKIKIVTTLVATWIVSLVVALAIPAPADGFGMSRVKTSMSAEDATSGRIEIWKSTIKAINEAPVIGHGSATYRFNMMKTNGYPYNHPHNFVLQFSYDWGILGGGLALFLLASLAVRTISLLPKMEPQKALAIGACGGISAMASIDGALFYPLPMAIAIALIAPAYAMNKSQSIN